MPMRRGMGGLSAGGGNLFDRPGFFDTSEIVKLTIDTELLLKSASETYGIKITHASTSGNNQDYEVAVPAVTTNDAFIVAALAQTLSNKTFASPKITTGIYDTTGNELLLVTATGSAVNELTLANASTTNGPVLSATGGDTNIDITLSPKGSGVVNITGNINVQGTSTTINSTTLDVDDKNITMGSVSNPNDTTADGGGLTLKGASDKTIIWDNTNDNWTSNQDWNIASGKSFKINNAVTLNATTLGSAVVTSSLTTVGTLASGAISSGFGAIDIGTSALSAGALSIDSITIDGDTISSTGAINFAATTTLDFGDKAVLNIGNLTIDSIYGDNNAIQIGDDSDDAVSIYRVNALTAIGDLDIGANDFRAGTITADGLTSGRVVFAGTNGVLSDDSDLTFATATLTATNISSGSVAVDNITIDGNTITSTDTNGNIQLSPNGTGDVHLTADTVRVGDSNTIAIITTNGAGSLKLNTNSGTDSGTIIINDGANGSISINPHGTGFVGLGADTIKVGDENVLATITTLGTGSLKLNTDSGADSGYIQITSGANGTIDIAPNGSGDVNITNVDIGSGNIDNTTLGAALAVTISGATIGGSLTWSAAQNLNNQNLTNVDINSGTINDITTFGIKQSGTSYEMQIAVGTGEDLTADTTLTIDPRNAARAITLHGNLTLAGDFITAGAYATTLTTTGTTGVTLPTTGTLSTLAGSETFTNKTLTSPVIAVIVSNSNNLTLPTTADTLVGRATTDTLTNKTISGGSNTLSAIGNSSLSNSTITIGGTSTALGGTITALTALTDLDLTVGNKTIFDTIGANTLTIGAASSTIAIAGDLTVAGTTTTTNTTTVDVDDPLMSLASTNTSSDVVDIGFYGKYTDSGTKYAGFFRDADDSDKWKLFATTGNSHAAPTTTVDTTSGFTLGTLEASTFEGALSGNASTATTAAAWTTARTLSFTGDVTGSGSVDGSASVATALTIQTNAVQAAMVHEDVISGRTELTSGVATDADFLLLWDATDSVFKKVKPDNLGVSGLAAGGSNLIQYASGTAFAGAANVQIKNAALALKEMSTPNAESGFGLIYTKTDNELYYRNDTDAEVKLTLDGAMAGGGAFRGIKAYTAADLSISDATTTTLTAWTEVYDVGAIHSASTNTDRFTFGVIGYYEIKGTHAWAADIAGYREMTVVYVDTSNSNAETVIFQDRYDGSRLSANSGSSTTIYVDDASDYVIVKVTQSSGASLILGGGSGMSTFISISRIDMATSLSQASGTAGHIQLSDGSGGFTSSTNILSVNDGVVIGHTAQLDLDEIVSEFQIHGTGYPDSTMQITHWGSGYPALRMGRSAYGTIGTWGGSGGSGKVGDGGVIGAFEMYVDDGSTAAQRTARILCLVDDASPATNAVGTLWQLSTTTTAGVETPALIIDAAQDVTIPNGSIAMGVVSDPSTVTDQAHIYVKDDPAEVYVRDEAGNVTQISPHNEQGEWEFHSYNNKTGKSFKVNMEHMIRKLEDITGESFIQEDWDN